jgi:D-beta-D-heptose 7-phosphate kinase/D-beta-D-heptose 1-phosphate adenosyltransferase
VYSIFMMFDNTKQLQEVIQHGFSQCHILVVGDIMLDRYYWGDVERISPEAPVPVLQIRQETSAPGGAANVARNLAALGARVTLAGVVGTDTIGQGVLKQLNAVGVQTDQVLTCAARPTTCKTRVIGNHQQMLRIDAEQTMALDADVENALYQGLDDVLPQVQAILLSDYAKGVLSDTLCQRLMTAAHQYAIPVVVDPKQHDFTRYSGATLITPNRHELAVALQVKSPSLEQLYVGAEQLRRDLAFRYVVITLGELGMAVLDDQHGLSRIPALAREVFDVSGAGDTAVAILTVALTAGLAIADAARLANLGAGLAVGHVGAASISAGELLALLDVPMTRTSMDKICTLEQALQRVAQWRTQKQRIVFTNGCFDLLHAGHATYLEQARCYGQRLIVGLNSDQSVQLLKGAGRPVMVEQDRARLLAALAVVDAVILFAETDPLELICAIKPDVLVKGADYQPHQVVGAAEVKSWGGELILIPMVAGRSTSALIAQLQQSVLIDY